LDGKPDPFVQQLAATPTDSLPEKWPRLLKELNRSVKQKNPNPEKRIKIPAGNKSQDRRRLAPLGQALGKVDSPAGSATGNRRFKISPFISRPRFA